MAEKKKRRAAEFAKDKNAFMGGSSTKRDSDTQKAKKKQSGAHQPRDADVTSGHDVQKPEQSKTFGYDVNPFAQQKNLKLRKKPDSDHNKADSKTQSGFPQEQNAFTDGEEQTGEAGDFKDGYCHRDTYQQSQKKGRYRRREYQDRERTKASDFGRDFQTKDYTFTESSTFTHDAEPEFQDSKKLDRLQKKAEKAGKKTEATRGKLPKKKEYSLERVFDEKTDRAKYVPAVVVKEKTFKKDNNVHHSARQNDLKLENKLDSNGFYDNRSSFQDGTRKNAGQKKPRRKKRRQPGQFQKENGFTENKEKPDNDNDSAGSKAQDGFFKEQNTFAEDGGEEQTREAGNFKDDYRRRDTYQQSQKKGRYRRREHQDRERTKTSDFGRDFQTKDHDFTEKNIFTEDGKPEFQGSKKLDRLQKKAEKAGKKTEAARKKLPKKKEYSLERVFDEKTGRAKYILTAVVKEKPFKEDNPVKKIAGRAGSEFTNYAHGKVAESEKENSAVEGAHKTEQKAEDTYRFVKRHYKNKEQRQRGKVAKLEKKQFQKEVSFRYQKFLEENPEMQEKTLKKQLQKRLQKQRIKREYAKARRAGQAAKNTKEAVVKSANFTTAVAKKLQEIAAKHASLFVTAGAFAVLLIMIMTSISSCGAMFSEGMSTMLAGSYMSVPAEIDAADLAFSELEMELQKEVDSVETDYPDYDEYRYNLDPIGHDPFALISYLSVVHTEFTAADVQGEIESIFDEMYELTLNPTEETRTRTVTKTGIRTVTNADGTTRTETYTYEEEEEYTVTILEVTLTAKDLNVVVAGRMDSEQKEIFALYNETHGLTQQFYTPLNLYWYNYVSSYYGYRINPVTGAEQFHKGVDIAVPTGTTVLAAMDGTITTATYDSYYGNYVVIEDSDGYCTKYAHMDTLSVSAGQTVKHGDSIGTTGNTGSSTGSHLHIECLYNGEYYNPLFYFEAGEGTLYGETPASGSGGGNAIPTDSYDDATVQTLMEEAAKYLGYPYVWGGSSPSTSFDCSGFVCWVFTNSGVHNLPRTTAQGIYDQCTPVSAADAKAGDIIFFTGTYNSAGAVSHVGIYCGNGVMIHCGDPIKYASINTSYWQSHFYAFARLN